VVRIRRLEMWQGPVQDFLQAKGGAALDVVFHSRPRRAAFLLGEIGERHAKKAREVQAEQVWALWQIGEVPRYSFFHTSPQRGVGEKERRRRAKRKERRERKGRRRERKGRRRERKGRKKKENDRKKKKGRKRNTA
jgi:hypothetical protein